MPVPCTHRTHPGCCRPLCLLLSSRCVSQSPTFNSPLWGSLRPLSLTSKFLPVSATNSFLGSFGKLLLCPETPWNNIGFTWQDPLTSFKDPHFFFIIVRKSQLCKSSWSIFSISLSQATYFIPDVSPSVCFKRRYQHFGPQLLSFPSPLPRQRDNTISALFMAIFWPSLINILILIEF